MATKKATRKTKRTETEEVDAIFEGVMHCEPAIPERLVDEIEAWAQSQEFGIARRVGLVVATKAGDWFKTLSEDTDTARTMCETLPALKSQVEALRNLADILSMAETRMAVALCNHMEFDAATQTMMEVGHA